MANEEVTYILLPRKEAKRIGNRYYFTGESCKRGHFDRRYIKNNGCYTCTLEKNKTWCKTHPRQTKERNRKYKGAPEKRRAQERARYAANPEKYRASAREKYWENPEKMRERSNNHYHASYEDEEVRRKAQERTRQWTLDNPERAKRNTKVAKHKRRALERNADGSFTADDIAAIYKAQKGKCAYYSCCRTKLDNDYHIDHINPLSKGGTNARTNLQLTCRSCNLSKAARDPIDHARKLGKLL